MWDVTHPLILFCSNPDDFRFRGSGTSLNFVPSASKENAIDCISKSFKWAFLERLTWIHAEIKQVFMMVVFWVCDTL